MLTRVELEQFKCFEKLKLPLGQLTLLTGVNAGGKSSVLQALLLLHQTMSDNEWSQDLLLDGSSISLGTASDVIDQLTGRNRVGIGLSWNEFSGLWRMETRDRTSLSLPLSTVTWRDPSSPETSIDFANFKDSVHYLLPEQIYNSSEAARELTSAIEKLAYISAERSGPRETYTLSIARHPTSVGRRGERTPAVLHQHSDRRPMEGLLLEGTPPTLQRQAESWMDSFFPGAGFELNSVAGASVVTLGIRTSRAGSYQRPQNVGFGLTHILPILTACLAAEAQDIILLENPEVHLHPSGQAQMGGFLARAAASGAQLLIETHSDHILNGVRRSVKEGVLRPDQVAIHFFAPRSAATEGSGAQVVSPSLDSRGGIDHWPAGFFDQLDRDLSFLAGWDD